MEGSGNVEKGNKKTMEEITFPVPFPLEEIKEYIPISNKNPSKKQIIKQAFLFHSQGNITEAAKCYQKIIDQGIKDYRVFSNYGVILKNLGKLIEAEISTQKAIELNPNFAEAYSNLGSILRKIGQLNEAEISTRKAIELNPNFANAHLTLGQILKDLGNLKEAELSSREAIKLNPNFADSHLNLGNILKDRGNLKEAETEFRKAIELNPDFANAYFNLGNLLRDLGNLKEAERATLKSIELKPNFTEAHRGLSIYYYLIGNLDLALNSILKAYSLDPKDISNELLLNIFKEERNLKGKNLKTNYKISNTQDKSLDSDPLILHRPVEKELIETLYKIKAQDQEKNQRPTFGNAIGSNYKLFNRHESMIKTIKNDLIDISRDSVKSDIFIEASFFTIFRSGGGLVSHNHLNRLDFVKGLNIASRKFSLVYYLSVGDQNCNEPGILKLEDPDHDLLPNNGLIIIFPAGRKHSVFYEGRKDRIIIGVNFYRI